MKLNWRKIFVGILSLCIVHCASCISVFAQPTQTHATASLDTTKIRIGEQTHLNLTATIPADAKLTFPAIADSIHKLEVVQRSSIDTSKSADGKYFTYHQSLTVTGFDSGFYVVEPFTFFFKKANASDSDSIATEALLLQVQTVPVDTTKDIKDIKPPLDVPFTFREALPYIIGGLVAIALVWLIVYYLKKQKRKPHEVVKKVPLRPAHEIALDELKKVEEQKLWQQGFYKQYQSAVADTIRAYIENRFSIQSLEMPSDDTLSHFKGSLVNEEAFQKLKYVLLSADMVKFAKAIPVGSENETSIQNARDFVMLTKQVAKGDFEPASGTEEKKEVPS